MRHINDIKRIVTVLAAFLLFFGVTSMAFGQAEKEARTADRTIGEITGRVIEEVTGQALFSATIGVWSTVDSTLVTGTASDQNGGFSIGALNPGSYYVVVSFVGYDEWTTPPFTITYENRRVELGTVSLGYGEELLGGVEVTAERADVAFEIDKTVYNTKNQISSTGGSATDVLQNIPSIEVDVDGNVSLRGNQNVRILINGKPSRLTGEFLASYLQQIPAGSIERVEVIPNPSAKYDPDGQAGAINIILKKETNLGTSGGLILGGGTNGSYNASANVGLTRGKLTLFANYGFRTNDRDSGGYNFRENRYVNPLTFVEQDSDGLQQSISHLINTSADYRIGPFSELSASIVLSQRNSDSESLNKYVRLGALRDITGQSVRESNRGSAGWSMDYSLAFRRTPEPSKNELTVEFRYDKSSGDNSDELVERLLGPDADVTDPFLEQSYNDLGNQDREFSLKTDYVRALGDVRFETGTKSSLRKMDNSFYSESFDPVLDSFRPDASLNNTFAFDEQVHAAYAIAGTKKGNVEAQIGIRAEQAITAFDLITTQESYENDYFSLFPSAFLAYNMTPTRQIKLSYSKRIQRPRTSQLNPFTTQTDPLNLRVGNPRLSPEYIHSFELSLQQFSRTGSLSITPYYKRTVDQIQRFKTIDASGISTLTFRNFDQSESYGAEIIGSLRMGNLSGFASFNAYKVVTDASNIDSNLASDAVSWSTRGNLSWQVRPGTDVQLFYFYRAPLEVAQGRISSFSVTNLSIRQKLLQDKASLTLRVSDPLDKMGFRFELDQAEFYQLGSRKWESRSVSLTLTYNFGKPPKRQQRRNGDRSEGSFDDFGIN